MVESQNVRPGNGPIDGIEVTPEMIEAGERCLNEFLDSVASSSPEVGVLYIPGEWAAAAFRAMCLARDHRPKAYVPKS